MNRYFAHAALLGLFVAPGAFAASVVINEFIHDDPSTDNEEFLELKNTTGAPVDISAWTIDFISNAGAVTKTVTVAAATIIPANDYWVIGAAATANVDVVDATLGLNDTQGAIRLKDNLAVVIDAVAYETTAGLGSIPLNAVEGAVGFIPNVDSSGSGNGASDTSVGRFPDGADTNDNASDFGLGGNSPGVSNNKAAISVVNDTFPEAADTARGEWWGTFVDGTVIDPTVVSAQNLYTIPASPGGGNALALWDSSGGRNANHYVLSNPSTIRFECYYFINSILTPTAPETDGGGIFVRAGLDSGSNTNRVFGGAPIDVSQGLGFYVERGNATVTAGFVNSVGNTRTAVGSLISVTPGVNDGWRRIRMDCYGSNAEVFFGGALGSVAGSHGTTTMTRLGGGIGAHYFENVTLDTSNRGPVVDNLTMNVTTVPVEMSIFATE